MAGALTGTISLTSSNNKTMAKYSSDALDATSLSSKATFPLAESLMATIQAVCVGMSSGTVSFKLQCSNDGTNFDDISGATGSIASATGSFTIHLSSPPGLYLRFQVTGAGGAGTITPTLVSKR